MDTTIEATGLGKRYRRNWALSECTLAIPAGRVVGLVGPNGAGKTTLLGLAAGLLRPTAGTIEVLGGRPGDGPDQLARVGFVAQDTPTYSSFSVADHLRLGAWTNPRWDRQLADRRIIQLGVDPRRKAGQLSGGQRAQLALTLAVAKRPELLLLDEPVAALDPLARREFLQGITDVATEYGVSVVLSSHLVADVERVCDHLVVLVASRVQLAGEIDQLIASHRRLRGPTRDPGAPTTGGRPTGIDVIEEGMSDGRPSLVVRTERPPERLGDDGWTVEDVSLEDLVLAYLGRPADGARS